MISIRRRLLTWFLLLSLVGWLVTMAAIWFQVYDEIEEVYDGHLVQTARELAHMVPILLGRYREGADLRGGPKLDALLRELSQPSPDNTYASTLSAHIWWHGHPLHTQSDDRVPTPHTDDEVRREIRGGQALRRYTYYDPTTQVLVEVTERHNARSHIITEVADAAIFPLVFLVPLLGLGAWFAVSRGLLPTRRIVAQIRRRTPSDLDPLQLEGAPTEIRPLLNALNQLFERVDSAMKRERRFTGDASHELRTPLAALRVQAQLAARTHDPRQREQALRQLIKGIDRTTHVVEQLLVLARLEPAGRKAECTPLQLRPLAEEMCRQLVPAAARKSVELVLMEDDVRICGDEHMLLILLRNLLDNAIRYTPPGGLVRVRCYTHADGSPCVEVEDTGPGIPPEQREYVLQRFARGEANDAEGCGLGLSIVRRIVDLHQARLDMGDAELGGLRIRVSFPAA